MKSNHYRVKSTVMQGSIAAVIVVHETWLGYCFKNNYRKSIKAFFVIDIALIVSQRNCVN
jgi:hypothetical protein